MLQERQLRLLAKLYPQKGNGEHKDKLSCSVTLGKKGNPFLGRPNFSGAATTKKGKIIGATEQVSKATWPTRNQPAPRPWSIPISRKMILAARQRLQPGVFGPPKPRNAVSNQSSVFQRKRQYVGEIPLTTRRSCVIYQPRETVGLWLSDPYGMYGQLWDSRGQGIPQRA